MAYPASKDNLPTNNPTATLSQFATNGLRALINLITPAINSIETKLGIDGSTDNNSIDYRVKNGWNQESNIVAYGGTNTTIQIQCTQSYFNLIYTTGRKLRINSATTPVYCNVLSTTYNNISGIGTITVDTTTVPNPVNSLDYSLQPTGSTQVNQTNLNVQSPSSSQLGGLTVNNLSGSAGITGSNIASGTITGSNIASGTITGSNIASSPIIAGTPTVSGVQKLASGNQAIAQMQLDSSTTNVTAGGTIGTTVNFGCVLSNSPSSLTFSGTGNNIGSLNMGVVSIYGVGPYGTVTASSVQTFWNGTVTTVGN